MKRKGHHKSRRGFTLVEVLIGVVLVGVAAVAVYQGIHYSYRTLLRSRAKLEAQGIAFDALWLEFNRDYDDLPDVATLSTFSTPAQSILSTNGIVNLFIFPKTNDVSSSKRWEMTVQVWAPSNSILFSVVDDDGTILAEYPEPLAEYTVWRYRGDR